LSSWKDLSPRQPQLAVVLRQSIGKLPYLVLQTHVACQAAAIVNILGQIAIHAIPDAYDWHHHKHRNDPGAAPV
jgi:hypothetical protein